MDFTTSNKWNEIKLEILNPKVDTNFHFYFVVFISFLMLVQKPVIFIRCNQSCILSKHLNKTNISEINIYAKR